MSTQTKRFAKALRRTAKGLAQEASYYRKHGEDLRERADAMTQSAIILARWANDVQAKSEDKRPRSATKDR